ncbi:YraN family protein [Robiginitalea sp. SC105]|uniref:YraN family protein n=1 Tax=Robiginitalea sp. SC105 TaxID=2762332 RepID=UPI00163A0DE3|nr:YraN family protein [Robiginitalea sp. SC105]MBC2838510.1 YraN family protein [Robiginitalea sp. SC105]
MPVETTVDIGLEGEEYAVAYLRKSGFRIRCRNYRYRRAEIDIIAVEGSTLVVIEVKTRTGAFYEALSDSISRAKIRRLTRAADHYVRSIGSDLEVRFDVIQIVRHNGRYRLTHLRDAFYFFP